MKNKLIILILTLFFLIALPSYCDEIEDATVFYNEAIDLYKQDEVEKSVELFTKAIELNPNFYEAHYNLAQILMSINRNEEALKSLETIAQLKPDDYESLYNIGKIQYKRGYLSKAYDYLKMIKTTAPQYESAKILIARIEKRQAELNLEAKIKENKRGFDSKGRAKAVELAGFSAPSGIAVDKRGNIYVASFLENYIYKISIYGQKTILTKSNLIKGPIGIAIDKNNNIYVANYTVNNIVKILPNNTVTIFAEIKRPYCLLYDEEHDRLYATEQDTNKLYKFDL